MNISSDELTFTFSRSSGAGGQNVNKVNSRVTLIWNIDHTQSINQTIQKRFKEKFSNFINNNNQVRISSQKFRTQARNITDATDKLYEMLESVKAPQKRRINTKPTYNSIKRLIKNKKNNSQVKKNRKKVDF